MLEVFARLGGLNLSLTTKSNLITRDIDLLADINRRSKLSVNFSLITINRKLQRVLEPRAPRPELRLCALRQLSAAGIECHVLMMPMIPGLNDSPAAIESVIRAAKLAGASQVWWRSLFLKPAAARRFLPFIKERFPAWSSRLEQYYGPATYAPRVYDDNLSELFERIRRKHGFGASRDDDATSSQGDRSAGPRPALQLSLGV